MISNLILLGLLALVAGVAFAQWKKYSLLCLQQQMEISRLREEKMAVFDLLHDLGEAFTDRVNIKDIMRIVLYCASRITLAKGAALYELDEKKETLRAVVVDGLFPPMRPMPPHQDGKFITKLDQLAEFIRSEKIGAQEGVMEEVLRNGFVLVTDATRDARFPQFKEEALCTRSFMAVALQYRGETRGVLAVASRKEGGAFTRADLEILKSIGTQAAYSLENARIYIALAEKERLEMDIGVAREIQRVLLPEACPYLPGYEVDAVNLPARQVSGDYYDFIALDQGRLGLVIADVSGKGVPASLVMTMCRSVLRSVAQSFDSPSGVLRELNRQLYPDIREDMFITMTYAVLDPAAGTVTIARAGHETPLFYHDGLVEPLRSTGMALGIDSGEVFDTVIQDLKLPLNKGEALLFYTDGVTEALDGQGQEFGRENLQEAVMLAAPDGADAIVRNIVERLERFRGTAEKSDDVTMITLYAGNK